MLLSYSPAIQFTMRKAQDKKAGITIPAFFKSMDFLRYCRL